MNRPRKIVENEKSLMEMLKTCQASKTVFEVKDAQQNLFSMEIESILDADRLLTRFKPLQKGSSELRLNWQYTFSFQDGDNTIYSFDGVLLDSQPSNFLLTFTLRDEVYRIESRQSQRISVENKDRVWAEIGKDTYRVLNLCIGGVGICIPESNCFQIGRELAFELRYEDRVFHASGMVKHIAPLSGSGFICGIALTYHNEESIHHIQKFIQETR